MRLALHLVYDGCLHKEALLQIKDVYLLQSPTSYHMAPNFCGTLLLWISIITCILWKYWPLSISWMCSPAIYISRQCQRTFCCHQMEYFPVGSCIFPVTRIHLCKSVLAQSWQSDGEHLSNPLSHSVADYQRLS